MPTTFYRQLSLTQEGILTIDQLPFHLGDSVEVIIRPAQKTAPKKNLLKSRYPLHGTLVKYIVDFFYSVSRLNEVQSLRPR
jgi:hypothetical protein